MKLLNILSFLIIAAIMTGCSQGDGSDEAQKLLNKQQELKDIEQQNLQGAKSSIEGTLGEMVSLEDSLQSTQSKLVAEKDKLRSETLTLQQERQLDRMKMLTARKDSLEQVLSQANTSLAEAERDSAMLSQNKDSVQTKGKVVSLLDKEVATKLGTGIEEIDAKMEALESDKRNLEDQISLNQRKTEVAQKKIGIMKDEKALYQGQKKKLYDDGAAQSEMDAVATMIETVDENIKLEEKNIRLTTNNVADYQESIDKIDKQRARLSEQIRKNYTTQEVLKEYMANEQEHLKEELVKLDTMQKQRIAERNAIATEKEALEKTLSGVKEQHSKMETEQLKVLEAKKAALEIEMANLEKQEDAANSSSAASKSKQLEQEYANRQAAISNEQATLEEQQKILASQKETLASESKQRKGKITTVILSVIGLGVLFLAGMYFLGKSKKAAQKRKA